jgi:pectin methylesterase-like acyl-CoA thioesterase
VIAGLLLALGSVLAGSLSLLLKQRGAGAAPARRRRCARAIRFAGRLVCFTPSGGRWDEHTGPLPAAETEAEVPLGDDGQEHQPPAQSAWASWDSPPRPSSARTLRLPR